MNAHGPLPLDGVRVIDISSLGPGPFSSMLLADYGADIVWVGLGLLKQEQWIAENRAEIAAPWMVGVGAAFDYHAGTVPWAPPILRSMGLEWLFRLILQPRLRAKRYWWSLVFVLQSVTRGLLGRWLSKPGPTRSAGATP